MITDKKKTLDLLGTSIDHTEDLDKIAFEGENGGIDAIFAVSTRLFFKEGQSEPNRLKAIDGIDLYCQKFADRLTHYIKHEGEAVPFDRSEALNYFRETADLDDPDEHTLFLSVVGFPEGRPSRQPLDTECRLSAAMPYWAQFEIYSEWAAANTFASLGTDYRQALISHVIDWANAVQPSHGTAGPSLIVDNTANHQRPGATIFPLLARFPGLDYDDGGSWITEAAMTEKIRSINWLTILDNSFVSALGGVETIEESLGEECPLHRYDDGIVIQAGPKPVIGDLNEGLIPEHYRKVSQVIKPIRFEDYRLGLLYPPEPLDRIEETLKWIRRFD